MVAGLIARSTLVEKRHHKRNARLAAEQEPGVEE
jgi:hypothetical protein